MVGSKWEDPKFRELVSILKILIKINVKKI